MFSKTGMVVNISLQRDGIVLPVLLVQPGVGGSTCLLGRKCRGISVRSGGDVLCVKNKRSVPLFLYIVIGIITYCTLYTESGDKRKFLLQCDCAQDIVR